MNNEILVTCCRVVRGFLRVQVCLVPSFCHIYMKSHVLEYKTPEQTSYLLDLFANQSSTNPKFYSDLLNFSLNMLNILWQFPKGDVPKWVHNAMEVAGVDISECCTPTNCQHDAMEDTSVDISEFCPPTKCPWRETFRGYLYRYHSTGTGWRQEGRSHGSDPSYLTWQVFTRF